MRTFPALITVALLLGPACGGPLGEDTAPPDEPTFAATQLGPPSIYPNPALTPGDVLVVPQSTVCKPGYTKGVRNVTPQERAQVLTLYGLVDVPGKYELDHFIALELGGSNAVTNLWPEPYAPVPGAHEKDQTENYLHAQMCSGKMTMAQAQTAIRTDWYAVYHGFTGK